MRVPDGAPEIVANGVATMVGGSWSDNGTVLVTGAVTGGSGLYAVPAAGGVAKRVEVSLPKDVSVLCWPEFLPDSEDFVVLAAAARIEESEIYLATLRDGRAADPVLLMKNATAARYTPAGGGRLLFVRNDNLYAQTLNRTARTLEGAPELIQQRVASSPSFHAAHFSVSRTGVVTWRPGTAALSQVTIFDREGKEIGMAGSPTVVQTLRLAPDETRLLVGFNETAWLLEPGRPGRQQLEQGSLDTLWSPDGSKFLAPSTVSGNDTRIMERSVTGQGTVRELAKPAGMWRLEDISPDGKTLLLSRGPLDTTVFSLSLDGVQKEPKSLLQTGEIDFTCPLFARRALDDVHGLRGGPRRDRHRRRHLCAALPRAGIPEAGDQPRQLSDLAQGWKGDRVSRRTSGSELHLVGSCGRFGRRVPGRYSVGLVSGSSSRDALRRLELPGRLARRLTLLYPAGGGTAELRRYPRPRGMGKMMVRTINMNRAFLSRDASRPTTGTRQASSGSQDYSSVVA